MPAYAELPLHGGNAPKWLFTRMVALGKEISALMVDEFTAKGFMERLSDPCWFQSLSCALGFDWHSSGTTTVTMGALKEAINNSDLPLRIAGGKGNASRNAPHEIMRHHYLLCGEKGSVDALIYASKMSAKVDSALVQDGYELYHHALIFDEKSNWCVVQQGLNTETQYARRYHWFSADLEGFVDEPQSAICCDIESKNVLDMSSKKSEEARKASVDIIKEKCSRQKRMIEFAVNGQRTLSSWNSGAKIKSYQKSLVMPKDIDWRLMERLYEFQPSNYEALVAMTGVGKKTIRALALISSLVYGSSLSWKDPVKYSFTVGGKDGVPFPVERKAMDEATSFLSDAIRQSRLNDFEKRNTLIKLAGLA